MPTGSPSRKGSPRANGSSSTALTSSATGPKWPFPARPETPHATARRLRRRPPPPSASKGPAGASHEPEAGERAGAVSDEPLAPLHSSPGRHLALDGGDHARGRGRLHLPAALRAAAGRLSHHPGADLLSRREPGCDDFIGDGPARAPIWADARP